MRQDEVILAVIGFPSEGLKYFSDSLPCIQGQILYPHFALQSDDTQFPDISQIPGALAPAF